MSCLFEYALSRFTARTKPNAPTILRTRGIGFQSIGEGKLGTPPVSKVFHSCPQVQNHLSSLRGAFDNLIWPHLDTHIWPHLD